jgi:8-oxo-dGTP pyrophosphatase MutT (NUDIX family)
MYKIFQREHSYHITDEIRDIDHYDFILNEPSKKALEQMVMQLEFQLKKPKNIWIRGDKDKYFSKFRLLFKEIRAGGGAVFNTKNELLLIKRLGFWDLPKGKWQKGETIEACAVREVEEECNVFGLSIEKSLLPTYHIYNYRGKWALKKTYWYVMHCTQFDKARPQWDEEIEEIRWMNLNHENIDTLHTYPAIKEVLLQLLPPQANIAYNLLHV